MKGEGEDGVDRMDEDGDEEGRADDEEAREYDEEGLEEDNLRELAPGSYGKAISPCLLS